MKDETYGRLMEATSITRHIRQRCKISVTTRNIPETSELEIKLPASSGPTDMQNVCDELEADGYALTCVGFNASRTVRVAAMGW